MDTIAEFEETLEPATVSRYNLRYSARFQAAPDLPLGEGRQPPASGTRE